MHYEINISHNGTHFFATHERSARDLVTAQALFNTFCTFFPRKDGFLIDLIKVENRTEVIARNITITVDDIRKVYDKGARRLGTIAEQLQTTGDTITSVIDGSVEFQINIRDGHMCVEQCIPHEPELPPIKDRVAIVMINRKWLPLDELATYTATDIDELCDFIKSSKQWGIDGANIVRV